jgi:TusA-related sulfurtransferase
MSQETKLVEIDMRGQVCPSTLLTALREINARAAELQRGETTLIFLADNRACTHTIPESASNMGYDAQVTKEEGCYRIRIARREGNGFL